MDATEIIIALRRAGLSQQMLASQLRVTHAAVNNVIHGRSTGKRIAKYIAQVVGKKPAALWPGRYDK